MENKVDEVDVFNKWLRIIVSIFVIGSGWGAFAITQSNNSNLINGNSARIKENVTKIQTLEDALQQYLAQQVTKEEMKGIVEDAIRNALTEWELKAVRDGRLNK
jgi:hypothetical protein